MPTYQDISRHTTNVILDPEVSSEIWANAIEESAFMRAARRINIPGSGVKVQTITGEPEANWVDETNLKPVGFHTFGSKTITPYKLAIIEPFSQEFLRDEDALYAECVRRLPAALGKKFDSTIMGAVAPGSGFDVLGTGVSSTSLLPDSSNHITEYDRFVAVDAAVSAADGIMDTVILAPQGKSILLGAKDADGYPLFTAGVGANTVGNILGAPVTVAKGVYVAGSAATQSAAGVPAVVGVAGDFSDVVWGSVEGVQMSVSDAASLSYTNASNQTVTINLWQQNMVAVRFEIEVAFAVRNKSQLMLLTGATPSA
ncbi:MAG: phage major capsid protein [Eggerthellaceae bacterium]|nr:phage major capsid protein [Eggerthellaceae bacterium]